MLGQIISAGIGFLGNERSNAATAASANNQMAFQERLSNTAVQRRMADMKKAGINPILAGKYDATTPAGAMYTATNSGAAAANSAQALTSAINTEQQTKNLQVQEDILEIDKLMKGDMRKVTNNIGKVAEHLTSILDWFDQIKDDIRPDMVELGEKIRDIQEQVHEFKDYPGNEITQSLQGLKILWQKFSDGIKSQFKTPEGRTTARDTDNL